MTMTQGIRNQSPGRKSKQAGDSEDTGGLKKTKFPIGAGEDYEKKDRDKERVEKKKKAKEVS